MDTADSQVFPTRPSLMKALMAGFDAISNHVGLILFSILLDLLLWLGPHLRVLPLAHSVLDEMVSLTDLPGGDMTALMNQGREAWLQWAEHFNLFAMLRSYPVGIPSLMVGTTPLENPLGKAVNWDYSSLSQVSLIGLVLLVAGLVIGALYFSVVAQAALDGKVVWSRAIRSWPWASGQVLLLVLFWFIVILAASIPFSCLLTLMFIGGPALSSLGGLFYLTLLVFLVPPIFLSPIGIFVYRYSMWTSVRAGLRLLRRETLMHTILFLLTIVIISVGMDELWRLPHESAWLAVVGIVGHAFIATSLVAATFVYYQGTTQWAQKMLQQAKLAALEQQH